MTAGTPVALSLVYGAWAMQAEPLLQLQDVYEAHLQGRKIDLSAVEARLGRQLDNTPPSYQVVDGGIAVLSLQGVIFPKANMFTDISGGASAQLLTNQVERAAADGSVRGMVFAIDSPGGSVLGTPELAAAMRRFAAVKPLVAHTDGVMASAAYWVGSAANAIFISGPTVQVGSIGVIATHRDRSAAQAQAGLKTTEITAGKYKSTGSENRPLDAAGHATIQAQVDYLYGLFVDTVASNRGVSVDAVLERMADGRVFIGQQAMDAGLVDGFASLDDLVATMAKNPAEFSKRRAASVATGATVAAPAPGASPPLPTRAEMAEQAGAYAAKHDLSLVAALKALGLEAAYQAAAERPSVFDVAKPDNFPSKDALVVAAKAHAERHGVSFTESVKALGYGRAPVPPAVTVHRPNLPSRADQAKAATSYAKKHSVTFIAAFKALGFDAVSH